MVSGGEEQKLAIARSLYRDAPFLVLDSLVIGQSRRHIFSQWPVQQLKILKHHGEHGHVLLIVDIPNEMYQGSLTVEKRNDRQYEVEFRDVSFRYPGSSQYALRHVNMRFKVGEKLAVVGQNGSGKTTFTYQAFRHT